MLGEPEYFSDDDEILTSVGAEEEVLLDLTLTLALTLTLSLAQTLTLP